jgi:hypothetical protein
VLFEQGALYGRDTRALVICRQDRLDIYVCIDQQVAEGLLGARATGRSLA